MESTMQVRFTFDDELMKKSGYERENVYYTIKKHFLQRGLKCISEDENLIFADTGNENDYGNMWSIILALVLSDWFVKCATSCEFEEDGETEDILIQVPELRKIYATA